MNYDIKQVSPIFKGINYFSLFKLIRSSWLTEGKYSTLLNERILDLCNAKYGVFAPNGTLSITMALLATGLKPGERVLIPDTTFFGTATAVILAGGIPVPVPVDSKYYLMDPEKLKFFLDEKTTHIVPVDLFGYSYDRGSIMQFAKSNNLKIVDDSAQALGVKYCGENIGRTSLATSYSFFADKTITMGEGGFVTTNDESVYESLRLIRNQGRLNRGSFIHESIGFNFRVTDMQAFIGLSQLARFDEIVKSKLENFMLYLKYLSQNSNIRVLTQPENSSFIPFRFIIEVKNLAKTIDILEQNSFLQTRRFFFPIHLQPGLLNWYKARKINLPNSDLFVNSIAGYEKGLLLPLHSKISRREIKLICDKINWAN
jgi:perosamine synthetase